MKEKKKKKKNPKRGTFNLPKLENLLLDLV